MNYHAAIVHGTASSWINKEPPYGRHADELLRMVPAAKLLILARDGRATALSMFKRRWMSSVRECMDRWGEFSRMTLEAVGRAPTERVLVLPYRDMVGNFEESLTTVHSFFELPEPDFDRLRNNPDGTLFPQTTSLDRGKREIDAADIAYFDSKYGSIMESLGLH